MSVFLMLEAQAQADYWRQRALIAERKLAALAAAAEGGDGTAPGEAPQSGPKGNAQ